MIRCVVEKRLFYNPANGYSVARLRTREEVPDGAAEGERDGWRRFSAVGTELPETEGTKVELHGGWVTGKYGLQLKVESYQEEPPTGRDELVVYLSSGSLKGIGPVLANRIVDRFGDKTLEVIENEPERLAEVRGISKKMIPDVAESYKQGREFRELVMALSPFGISNGMVKRIQNHFEGDALRIINNNPFRLCEMEKVGFPTADKIARAGGNYRPNDKARVKAGILHVLMAGESNGHLFLPSDYIVNEAVRLLNQDLQGNPVTQRHIKEYGNEMAYMDGSLVAEGRFLYRTKRYDAEVGTVEDLYRIARSGLRPVNVEKELAKAQRLMGVRAAGKQLEAVRNAFAHPVSVITGGPGMGKTFAVKLLLGVYQTLYKKASVLLCAPTGRASRVMAQKSGHPAVTLHKATNTPEDGDEMEAFAESDATRADLVIVDEFSMVDASMANRLFRQIKTGARVILVGDADQLPSIGPGNVFQELIRSRVVPTTVLNVIFRQKEGSLIVINAKKIVEGETDLEFGEGFHMIHAPDDEQAAKAIRELYLEKLEEAGGDCARVQVLTPFRKDTKAGANALNEILEGAVNPTGRKVGIGGSKLRVGDKVMQTKNKDEVSNGDMGYVIKSDGKEMGVSFGDGRFANYGSEDLNLLALSYAVTIHKSQGDEYPTVIIPMLACHRRMLRRRLLYTAVTRAKGEVYVVGSTDALNMAIRTDDEGGRNTLLAARLRKEFGFGEKGKNAV